jgi:hypothetical protein
MNEVSATPVPPPAASRLLSRITTVANITCLA